METLKFSSLLGKIWCAWWWGLGRGVVEGHSEKKYSVTHCNNLYASNQNTRTVAGRTSTKLTLITTRTATSTNHRNNTRHERKKFIFLFFAHFHSSTELSLLHYIFPFFLFLISWVFFQFTLNNYILDFTCFWMWDSPHRDEGLKVISAKGLLDRQSFSIRQIGENPKSKQ